MAVVAQTSYFVNASYFDRKPYRTYIAPTLRLIPLVFLWVAVAMTTGVGIVFRLISCFQNFTEMAGYSCVACLWSDQKTESLDRIYGVIC